MTKDIKAWVSKFALTRGVYETEGYTSDTYPDRFTVEQPGFTTQYFRKGEWHLTELDAYAQVLKMITSRRKSIDNEIKRLDALESLCLDFMNR